MSKGHGRADVTIRREQGRLAELAPVVRHFVKDRGAGAAWRPGLALIYADLGNLDAARREFDDLAAAEFAIVPRDALWETCLCYLAEVCYALGDRDRAAWLYDRLEPYRELAVVIGNTTVCLGATARYLGELAALLGREDSAEALFEQAIGIEGRIGAELWLAHTRLRLAELFDAAANPARGPGPRNSEARRRPRHGAAASPGSWQPFGPGLICCDATIAQVRQQAAGETGRWVQYGRLPAQRL